MQLVFDGEPPLPFRELVPVAASPASASDMLACLEPELPAANEAEQSIAEPLEGDQFAEQATEKTPVELPSEQADSSEAD
jgi:hypothetical protein